MSKYLYPSNPRSLGARRLARELGIRRIAHEGSVFRGDPDKTVINWGATELPHMVAISNVINAPGAVELASNKLKFFEHMFDENMTPQFTSTIDGAKRKTREGRTIVCRTILRGHSGNGIVIARTEDELVDAPLYVEYKKKADEYRVHVFRDRVFDVQRKARRLDIDDEDVNWQVRNHANGFIYQRENVNAPSIAIDAALKTVAAIGLDFGAVDIIWNAREERPYVLEVNTAPGLEGTTLERYAEVFRNI